MCVREKERETDKKKYGSAEGEKRRGSGMEGGGEWQSERGGWERGRERERERERGRPRDRGLRTTPQLTHALRKEENGKGTGVANGLQNSQRSSTGTVSAPSEKYCSDS